VASPAGTKNIKNDKELGPRCFFVPPSEIDRRRASIVLSHPCTGISALCVRVCNLGVWSNSNSREGSENETGNGYKFFVMKLHLRTRDLRANREPHLYAPPTYRISCCCCSFIFREVLGYTSKSIFIERKYWDKNSFWVINYWK